jgi:glutathione S-transferase
VARTEADAALLGIAYLGVKDIYSADNSSPQTTEINANKRAPTLMKWVNIAAVESLAIVALLTAAAPKGHKRWPSLGGLLALVVTYGQYIYAKNCGLQNGGESTETDAIFAAPVPTARAVTGRPR